MTDRPIIFSASMVKALLDGRKTMTRRVLKPSPFETGDPCPMWPMRKNGRRIAYARSSSPADANPYAPGDRLWVRETWARWWTPELFGGPPQRITEYRAGKLVSSPRFKGGYDIDNWPSYVAEGRKPDSVPWKSPIHMPRKLSRLTLIVTDVRVQRLAEITPDDCRAEGHPIEPGRSSDPQVHDDAARDWFMDFWDSLNGKKPDCAWADNPWVCAISFRCIHQNIDQLQRPGKPAEPRK